MNEPQNEPLDRELMALLREERAPDDAAARERVAGRLVRSVGALALGQSLVAKTAATSHASAWFGHALRARALGFAASFALGGAAGAVGYARLRPPPPVQVVYVERAVHSPTPPAPPNPAVPEREAEPKSTAPVAARPTSGNAPAPSASVADESSLNEQQVLLDVARSAFARSDYDATLATLSAHARRFPRSILSEEREALEIKALAASGRTAEAQARATRFKAEFPQSLLLPSVNDSVRENQ